jgi:hypothetical protein
MEEIVQETYGSSESVAVQPLRQPLEGADRDPDVEVGGTNGTVMAESTLAGWETIDTRIALLRAVDLVVQL